MGDRSVHAGGISQSVVVTGDGNTVSLVFGTTGIALSLRRPQIVRPERRKPAIADEKFPERVILMPDSGKLPFIGREDLLAELRAWLAHETDISVHALTAAAGTGKTRLAIALCGEMDGERTAKGEWIAGFLSADDLPAIVEVSATHRFDWERNTLLVIDYAARRYGALARWLDRLAATQLEQTKLRILLLEREAPRDFGWWHELTSPGEQSKHHRSELFHTARPHALPDLADLEERRRLMSAALAAALALRPPAALGSDIPAKGENPHFDSRLSAAQFGNPLSVVMAGVIALERGPEGGLAVRRLDAARYFGERELDRFEEMAKGSGGDGDAMRHLVVFNGLAGGLPVAGLREAVDAELEAARRSAKLDPLLDLLEQELPPRAEDTGTAEPHLRTIQPDLIGEAATVGHFSGRASRQAEAPVVVRRAYALGRDRAARALFRLVQDFGFAAEDPAATQEERETGKRVLGWFQTLARDMTDLSDLIPLVAALPRETLILREQAAELTHRLAQLFPSKLDSGSDPGTLRGAAWSFSALANRLSDLGRWEAALAVAEEAVRLYRALAEARPDAFRLEFARSLRVAGDLYAEKGDYDDGMAALGEGIVALTPAFVTLPLAFRDVMVGICRSYISLCETIGREPEEALLAPVAAALAELSPGESTQ